MTPHEKLLEVAKQLEVWADESVDGGWSTHQIRPMRDEAVKIRSFVRRSKCQPKSTTNS